MSASAAPATRLAPPRIALSLRASGAVALLAVGAIHLQRYLGAGYREIPTIGPLFLLNAIGAAVLVVALFALPRRLAPLAALAAIGLAAGALVALFVSESRPLFGFMEVGYGTPVLIALISEAATVLLLGAWLLTRSGRPPARRPRRR